MMPELDGFGVMEQLRHVIPANTYLPILILTADISAETKRRALGAGARDFLTKPFDATEALLRMQNLLETRSLHLQLKDQNHMLEERVAQRTAQLEESQFEVLQRLARAAEYRDDDTGQHTNRVGHFAAEIARRLGMNSTEIELLQAAAPLHDVGKIGIADSILLKAGSPYGGRVCHHENPRHHWRNLLSGGQSDLVQLAELIARSHHERWDGSGYPQGLRSDNIPLCGRIVALADVFDALTHERPYKQAWPIERGCGGDQESEWPPVRSTPGRNIPADAGKWRQTGVRFVAAVTLETASDENEFTYSSCQACWNRCLPWTGSHSVLFCMVDLPDCCPSSHPQLST
jgi:putative two-component system response regulator